MEKPPGSIVMILSVTIAWSLLGCAGGEPPLRVYSQEEPDLAAPPGQELHEIAPGDPVAVVLIDGSRFEATFEGQEAGDLRFSELEWEDLTSGSQDLALQVAKASACALEDVAELYLRQEGSTTDAILGWGSLAALAVLFGVYSYGQGGDSE